MFASGRCRRRVCGNFVANHPPGFGALAYRRSLWVDCADKCFTTAIRDWPSERSQDRSDVPGNTTPGVLETSCTPGVFYVVQLFEKSEGEIGREGDGENETRLLRLPISHSPFLPLFSISTGLSFRRRHLIEVILLSAPADEFLWPLRPV